MTANQRLPGTPRDHRSIVTLRACAVLVACVIAPPSLQAQVATLEITDENFDPVGAVQLQLGDSLFVGAEAFGASGNALDPASLTFRWTSSNLGVVEVRPRDGFEVYIVATGRGRASVEILVNRYTQILQVSVAGAAPVVVAAVDSVLPAETMSSVLGNVVMITSTRLGATSCHVDTFPTGAAWLSPHTPPFAAPRQFD